MFRASRCSDRWAVRTGWPSFTRPLEAGDIAEKEDRSWFLVQTEVRSRQGDSQVGKVFRRPQSAGLR
ncbi:MAG TPA: peptide-methionine (R)-S-oxide reductase [Nitrospirota bacterium]|nr:peptide-methionine (R)-S-oxide reductase [Nitrospirota bacterium]